MHENFRIKKFFETQNCSPMKSFWQCETKIFPRKIVITPPPPIHKCFFATKNFVEHRMVPRRNFSVLWDKKNFRKNRESSPLRCLKIFDTRILSKHRSVLLRILAALWDKNFRGRNVNTPLLLWFVIFFDTPNFVKHWRGAHEHFLHCDTKIFRRKNVITPFHP